MTAPQRRKRSTRRASHKKCQTPEQAAEILVRNLLRQLCGDFLDLVEDEGHDPAVRERDYANLKLAVRRQHQLPTHDLDDLRNDVLAAVSKEHFESTEGAMDTYIDAAADEIIVRENAAYILGVAVGRAFGDRASLRDPF